MELGEPIDIFLILWKFLLMQWNEWVCTGAISDVLITIWDFRENPKEAVFSF